MAERCLFPPRAPDSRWISLRLTAEAYWRNQARMHEVYSRKLADKSPAWIVRPDGTDPQVVFGRVSRQTAEVGARRVIAQTPRKQRLTSDGFKLISANHRIKVALARRLRRETIMDLKWIARERGVASCK